MVKSQHKKTIGFISPSNTKNRKPTKMLGQNADFIKCIRKGALKNPQLPEIISETNLYKPDNWQAAKNCAGLLREWVVKACDKW